MHALFVDLPLISVEPNLSSYYADNLLNASFVQLYASRIYRAVWEGTRLILPQRLISPRPQGHSIVLRYVMQIVQIYVLMRYPPASLGSSSSFPPI